MKNQKPIFWIIAGTSEGRILAQELSRYDAFIYVSVATEYGKGLIAPGNNLEIMSQRLNEEAMVAFINDRQIDCVLDATHPYAREVTQNMMNACKLTDTRYLRALRGTSDTVDLNYTDDYAQAAEVLTRIQGRVFLTTGSKEIEAFCAIPDYPDRLFARVLPMPEAIQKCLDLGFKPQNLIGMQGPFTKELNLAMFKACAAEIMVTKDSGDSGGFREKVETALELGMKVIVIGRPLEESGYTVNEVLEKVISEYDLCVTENHQNMVPYFPMFVSLENKKVTVFGGGVIAARRVRTLLHFGCVIEVIAPEFNSEVLGLSGLKLTKRCYSQGDCASVDLVVAATNDPDVNRMIAQECQAQHIPVSVADDKSLCSFYFPAVITQDEMVIGVTASGKDHGRVKRTAEKIRNRLQEIME